MVVLGKGVAVLAASKVPVQGKLMSDKDYDRGPMELHPEEVWRKRSKAQFWRTLTRSEHLTMSSTDEGPPEVLFAVNIHANDINHLSESLADPREEKPWGIAT